MMHAFTAGAWNPDLMKAGFAVLLTDGTDADGLTAEGALDCEKLADEVRAEIVALQGIGLLLKLSGDGETAVAHVSHPDVYGRMAGLGEKPLARMIREGIEFTDYFSEGSFLYVEDIAKDKDDPYVKACMERVCRMADIKAGLIEAPGETEAGT